MRITFLNMYMTWLFEVPNQRLASKFFIPKTRLGSNEVVIREDAETSVRLG